MIATVMAAGVQGVDGFLVRVEVSAEGGSESRISVVGLPEGAVRESQVRIRSALRAIGCPAQSGAVTINLAPAHIRKSGAAYDLPMALALLLSRGSVPPETLRGRLSIGELSLNGDIRPVRGVLPVVIAARELGMRSVVVPWPNGREAAVVEGIEVLAVRTLSEAVAVLRGEAPAPPLPAVAAAEDAAVLGPEALDLADVCGQERAKRALEIAAAGGHGLLMSGPPGSGKSMLARRLITILPTMSLAERLETTKIHSVAGLLRTDSGLITDRPFRAPHHTSSDVALVGGGSVPRPGEISLAHNGVLFLDELPEFRRAVLEVLRQPLEERAVTVARAAISVTFPARFALVAAMNPCPCGYLGDPRHKCRCSEIEVARYRGRISGPLLDRIDLQVTATPVPFEALHRARAGEPSSAIRGRVEAARQLQRERFNGDGLTCNADLGPRGIRRHCALPAEATALLQRAVERFGLSARAHDRVLRVARTIADLAAEPRVRVDHLVEALELRGATNALN